MRSPNCFIVEPVGGARYNTTKKVGNITFIISTSEEDHMASNREAVVIDTPITYSGPIKKGDILLVHHNVFKFYNDVKGRRKSGKSFFRDNTFLVDYDQFFLYRNESGWHAYDRFCFVKPIPPTQHTIIKNPNSEEPLMGVMEYPSEKLKRQGVKAGDLVGFAPDSEYEFTIDGQKMYRIYEHQITMIL